MLLVDLGLGCLQRLEGVLDAVVVSMLVDSRAAQRVTECPVQHQRCSTVFASARRDVCVCVSVCVSVCVFQAPNRIDSAGLYYCDEPIILEWMLGMDGVTPDLLRTTAGATPLFVATSGGKLKFPISPNVGCCTGSSSCGLVIARLR